MCYYTPYKMHLHIAKSMGLLLDDNKNNILQYQRIYIGW